MAINKKENKQKVSRLIGKRFIILTVAALIIITTVVALSFYPLANSVDNIGGKYQAAITHFSDHSELSYTDESGQHTSKYFDEKYMPALTWVNSSTPENATVLCWWDYGHMIKAVGERNAVLRNPSHEIISSIGNQSSITEFDSNDKIQDIAQALTTSNQTQTAQIMQKYNATYLLVAKDDQTKAVWLFRIAGLNESDNVSNQGNGGFTDLGTKTMIARLLDNRDTGPFTVVYSDTQIKIYQLT